MVEVPDGDGEGVPADNTLHDTGLPEPVLPTGAAPQFAGCVVVNTDPHSLIRRRRPLYEAVLRLEADMMAVVDRRLPSTADLALSAHSCFCAWTEDALKVPFLPPGAPVCERAPLYGAFIFNAAFSRTLLIGIVPDV